MKMEPQRRRENREKTKAFFNHCFTSLIYVSSVPLNLCGENTLQVEHFYLLLCVALFVNQRIKIQGRFGSVTILK